MSWWHPADVGFAVRSKLADVGFGARLMLRLLGTLPATLRRPALLRDQIHFMGNYSLAIIAVSGILWALCWACRATTRCSATVRRKRWGSWWL
jgi:ABC-type transporter Mla maintaining outer membrane lipid asymmetry permease subunit MlaE